MKKWIAILAAATCSASGSAQTTVNVYGLLDVGISRADNVAGKNTLTIDNGVWQSSRFGFRGAEDLGGGLKALFTIEGGFSLDTGAGSSALFGRQSFVGVSSPWGTVTLGRQYDFVYYLADGRLVTGGLEAAVAGGPGGAAGALKPLDTHAGGVRYDNSIKWTNKYGPIGVGLMYGLGLEKTVPGSTDKVTSATITYDQGGLQGGIAWVKDNYNTANSGNNANEVLTMKGTYQTGPWLLLANATTAKSRNSLARHRPVEVGFMYNFTAPWAAGLAVSRAKVTNAVGREAHTSTLMLGTTYDLSKRTLLYLVGAINKSSDASVYRGHVGSPGGAAEPSSDDTQNVIRVGIRHVF